MTAIARIRKRSQQVYYFLNFYEQLPILQSFHDLPALISVFSSSELEKSLTSFSSNFLQKFVHIINQTL